MLLGLLRQLRLLLQLMGLHLRTGQNRCLLLSLLGNWLHLHLRLLLLLKLLKLLVLLIPSKGLLESIVDRLNCSLTKNSLLVGGLVVQGILASFDLLRAEAVKLLL